MKILVLVSSLIFTFSSSYATDLGWISLSKQILKDHASECKQANINITEIVKNSHIQGKVTGLKEASYDNFKVLFYVQTNKWYIHPYQYNQNQPSGFSYADLNTDGSFWIRSVFRTPSKKMVAIVVPSPHYIYPIKTRLTDLLKYSCKYIEIPGNGDFAP